MLANIDQCCVFQLRRVHKCPLRKKLEPVEVRLGEVEIMRGEVLHEVFHRGYPMSFLEFVPT